MLYNTTMNKKFIVVSTLVASFFVGFFYLDRQEPKSDLKEVKDLILDLHEQVQELKDEIDDVKKTLRTNGVKVKLSAREIRCLEKNVFYEAGIEPMEGKIAVAQITYNRVKFKHRGTDVCAVVHARKQFSWTLDKKKVAATPKGELWKQSKEAVEKFLDGVRVNGLENSRHYHADYIKNPAWTKQKEVALKIGQHIFYKE